MTHSTRVSNELGAGHPIRAKIAMGVTLRLSILLALAVVLALAFGHNTWAAFFSNSPSIINQFASMIPLLLISITIDSFQGVLSGIMVVYRISMLLNFEILYSSFVFCKNTTIKKINEIEII